MRARQQPPSSSAWASPLSPPPVAIYAAHAKRPTTSCSALAIAFALNNAIESLIHILWDGPHTLDAIRSCNNSDTDCAIYQIYPHHPVYGASSMVYIGQTTDQTFAVRVLEHQWDTGSENDPRQVTVYIGRLIGPTPDLETWRRQIDMAEQLLIHSHGPAYNSHRSPRNVDMFAYLTGVLVVRSLEKFLD
jgi:hypothetical protein